MRCPSRLAALSATLLALGWLAGCGPKPNPAPAAPEAPPAANQPSGPGNRYALLVGCTKYDNLPDAYWLDGPANDVVLLRQLLVKHFGFPDGNVVTLAEAAGKDRRPTRANIERQFHELAEKAKPGDKVVITLSGHGSRQPEKNPPPDLRYAEPDGMDETFLPCDIKNWDSEAGTVTNAVIDDDIRVWTKAITDKGASVWLIADSCHSGDLLKGEERTREIKPDLLHVPGTAIKAARDRAAKRDRPRGNRRPHPQDVDESAQRLVAIYAAMTSEETVEKPMPDGKSYGLLSYTICQILSRAREPLSYRTLVRLVDSQYRGMGRKFPTPLVDGPDADAVILGSERVPSHLLVLKRDGGGWSVNAGTLQGVTTGSVLAVFPAAANAGKPVGHVTVTHAGSIESSVEPCAYGGLARRDDLPDGAGCDPVFINYGDLRLKVAADEPPHPGEQARGAGAPPLQQEIRRAFADRDHSLVEVVADPRKADWLVREQDGKVYLLPAEGVELSRAGDKAQPPRQALYGPLGKDDLGKQLRDRLSRIAKAKNLLRMAAPAAPGQDDSTVQVDLEIKRYRGDTDQRGTRVDWQKDGAVFYAGEPFRITVHNPNPFGIYVTVLYVDQDYGITALYPKAGESVTKPLGPDNKVPLEAEEMEGAGRVLENCVVIAVRDPGYPVDFRVLAQSSLGDIKARGLDSPL
ncbi:MAG TPA: caspase family protein, partial [Gemmataceae bacterium]|nr:caspase family protein [Gemmataceae bacterium]